MRVWVATMTQYGKAVVLGVYNKEEVAIKRLGTEHDRLGVSIEEVEVTEEGFPEWLEGHDSGPAQRDQYEGEKPPNFTEQC